MGLGKPIDFSKIGAAAWFGLPNFAAPVFDAKAMVLIAPVAIVLVAENLGHIKAIGAMTGRNLDPLSRPRVPRRRHRHDGRRRRAAAPASRPTPRTWA